MTGNRILIALGALLGVGGLTVLALDATLFAPVALPTPTIGISPSPLASGSAETFALPPSQQRFVIDPAQSEVRYEVGETFFNENNRFAVAVGRTQGISGEILVDSDHPSASQVGELLIDVSQFTSDESRRDNFIRRSGLESAAFPMARFVPTAIEGLPEKIAIGQDVTFTLEGELTVKETTRPVSWQVSARLEADRLVGTAETEILMSDFGVGPIRISFLATEDIVRLVFEFVAVATG